MQAGAGVFTSAVDLWSTPDSFMDVLRDRYGTFDLDPCCVPSSAKAPRYFTPADDGLSQSWTGKVFMNPPYGRGIDLWVRKASESGKAGAQVVCLVPARTDTRWWHEAMLCATEILFVEGRLHFGGDHEVTAHNAPFPSAVIVFDSSLETLRVGVVPRALRQTGVSAVVPAGTALTVTVQ